MSTQSAEEKTTDSMKDNGLLNIIHKPIKFYADANHRVKTYVGSIFSLCRMRMGLSKGNSMDGEQMKRNMGYVIHQNKTGDLGLNEDKE
jgi:hypothetical protein